MLKNIYKEHQCKMIEASSSSLKYLLEEDNQKQKRIARVANLVSIHCSIDTLNELSDSSYKIASNEIKSAFELGSFCIENITQRLDDLDIYGLKEAKEYKNYAEDTSNEAKKQFNTGLKRKINRSIVTIKGQNSLIEGELFKDDKGSIAPFVNSLLQKLDIVQKSVDSVINFLNSFKVKIDNKVYPLSVIKEFRKVIENLLEQLNTTTDGFISNLEDISEKNEFKPEKTNLKKYVLSLNNSVKELKDIVNLETYQVIEDASWDNVIKVPQSSRKVG